MRALVTGLYFLILPVLIFAQEPSTSKLTGTVYDAYGAVIVGAKVTAVAADGKKFPTVTNDEGVYVLSLSFTRYYSTGRFKESKYDLVVESIGFQRSEIKGYVFIPSYSGEMTLDIGLEIAPCSDCHMIEVAPTKRTGKPQ